MKPPNTLLDTLAEEICGPAQRIMIGLNWTLVEGQRGVGLAHSPVRGTSGCYSITDAGEIAGRSLKSLAASITSDNPFDRALAQAAINAHYNKVDLAGSDKNGLDLVAERPGETIVIGRFPGLETRIPDAKVIERAPGPDDYSLESAPDLLPKADQLLITASTLADGSLPNYLSLAPNAFSVLIGPGTPLSPTLFDFGLDVLAGFVIDDKERAFTSIAEGGAVKALKKYGRNVCLHQT